MTTPSLDHLILFLPRSPTASTPKIPSPLIKNFTLTPGGTHADNLTANTLILLSDGCYLELITFLPSPDFPDYGKIDKHWWGPASRHGWTDWCLTNSLSPAENYERIKDTHAEPISGGRKRPDGKDVKWAVTFPKGEHGGKEARGRIPFFCHDVTDREVRVPIEEEKVVHASGVVGVGIVTVVVKDKGSFHKTAEAYAKVLGTEGRETNEGLEFGVSRVRQVEGLKDGPKVVLRLPKSEEEVQKVEQRGYWCGDVTLLAKVDGKNEGEVERIDDGDSVGGFWIKYV